MLTVVPVWKVARYTSAAPLHFYPEDDYIDGGIKANNPTDFVLTKIQKYFDEHDEIMQRLKKVKLKLCNPWRIIYICYRRSQIQSTHVLCRLDVAYLVQKILETLAFRNILALRF